MDFSFSRPDFWMAIFSFFTYSNFKRHLLQISAKCIWSREERKKLIKRLEGMSHVETKS